MLLCLYLSLPSPMTTTLQKIPVSVYCVFTSLRSTPIAQAPGRAAGQEEDPKVIAKEETALFVVAAAGLRTSATGTRGLSPVRHQDGD